MLGLGKILVLSANNFMFTVTNLYFRIFIRVMKILNFSCIWDTAALKLLTVLLKVVSGEVPGAGIGSSTAGECLNGELS